MSTSFRRFAALVSGTMLLACTRPTEPTLLQVRLPVASPEQRSAPKKVNAQNTSAWSGSASLSSEVNCYLVMVGADEPNLRKNSCTRRGETTSLLTFGPAVGGVPAGGTIEIAVESGPSRTISLFGYQATADGCKDIFKAGPPTNAGTFPRLLAQSTTDLKPGLNEVTLTIPSSLADLPELEACIRAPESSDTKISAYLPSQDSVTLRSDGSQQFLVVANSQSLITYTWSLDGTPLTGNSPTFALTGASTTVGNHKLKVTASTAEHSASREWTVKVNGAPAISTSAPSSSTAHARRSSPIEFSVTPTDPNGDTLTYVWKLDGQDSVLSSTTNTATWTPSPAQVGQHFVSVDIYDGPPADPATHKVTRSWTTSVNHFANACNALVNSSLTNKSCVYSGIPGIGDELNPLTDPTRFYLRPGAIETTPTGNIFIADEGNHVVWFWNRSSSPSTNMLGIDVPINTMKVVAGVGVAGSLTNSKASRSQLSNPSGLLWDGTYLYVTEAGNNRAVRIDGSGDVVTVFTSGCLQPRGIAKIGATLYFACYGSHTIRQVDSTNFATTSVFAGTGSGGNPAAVMESAPTAPNGILNGPYGLTTDAGGNLYVGEYDGCRIRMYNLTGSTITLYGSYSISAGNQRIIAGTITPTCTPANGEPVNLSGAADAAVGRLKYLSFAPTGELLFGQNGHKFGILNFSASNGTILGATLPAASLTHTLASGVSGYVGEGDISTTRFNTPAQIKPDPVSGDYFVADTLNQRLRRLRADNLQTALVAGNGTQRGSFSAGNSSLEVGQEKMFNIRGFAFDSITRELFVTDAGNNRIRAISQYGVVTQAVGTGTSGTGAEENEVPLASTMNTPRGITLIHRSATFGGHLVWADTNNHRVRLMNRGSSPTTVFGVYVDPGNVVTIAGSTSGNATSGTALANAFNTPSGVAFDGASLYVADSGNHCVKKIDASGTLSVAAGTCGTAGNANGAVGTGRLNFPEGLAYYDVGSQTGLVIADRANSRIRYLRLGGTGAIFGTPVTAGQIATVACGGTLHNEGIVATLATCNGTYDVTVAGDQFCFTNQMFHNARCVSATGLISTVMGPAQGDGTTPLHFSGGAFAHDDFNPLAPNPSNQNGVPAVFLPFPVAAPGLNESFSRLVNPMPILAIDASTIFVGENGLGLIRKTTVP